MMGFWANRLFCLVMLLMVVPVAASGAPVIRSLSTAEPGEGEVFTVSLSIEGMALGGVVETLPAGYAFVETGHPDDRVLVRGQQVAFAVMNDTAIAYSVRAPAAGSGDITGQWEDFINESDGPTLASHVAVNGIDVAASEGADPTSPAARQAASPFAALAAVAGLLLAAGRGGRQ